MSEIDELIETIETLEKAIAKLKAKLKILQSPPKIRVRDASEPMRPFVIVGKVDPPDISIRQIGF